MFQFLLRAVGFALLALAMIFAILDVTRSITASQFVVTPLGGTLDAWLPESLPVWRTAVEGLHPMLWDPVAVTLLGLPTWLVTWVVAMLALWLGQKAPDRFGRFASR